MRNNVPVFSLVTTSIPALLISTFYLLPMATCAQTSEAPGTAPAAQQRSPEADQILKLYNDARYIEAAQLGNARLAVEPDNHELRFAVANSYAWTGKLSEAVRHYKALQGSSYEDRAALGLANVYRWDGLYGLALPLYQQALKAMPEDKDAKEGMAYLMRELRPRTQLGGIWVNDSLNTFRNGAVVSQRWTDASMQHRMEIEAGALRDRRNALNVDQRDLTFRYEGVGNPLKPRATISGQETPRNALFASAEIQLPNLPVVLSAGHVNWGKLAFDPNALKANLSANRVGVQARAPADIGLFTLNYIASRVTDGNTIQDINFKFKPTWQPLKKIPEVKFFVGFEGRKAAFNSPAYWSPKDGNYLGVIGVEAEWQDLKWERGILLGYGIPLGGEARTSTSAYGRAKRWIGNDWAVVFTVGYQESSRTGAYRSTSASFSIEKLW
jgi:tetratricopeptide (TPR) repeat protein